PRRHPRVGLGVPVRRGRHRGPAPRVAQLRADVGEGLADAEGDRGGDADPGKPPEDRGIDDEPAGAHPGKRSEHPRFTVPEPGRAGPWTPRRSPRAASRPSWTKAAPTTT